MKFLFLLFTSVFFLFSGKSFSQDVFQMNEQNKSLTYDEALAAYRDMAGKSIKARLIEKGLTDCGKPLHLFILSNDGTFDPQAARKKNKIVVLVNNGIHPGEPDGIDASVRLAQSYLNGKKVLPDNVVICIIPVYNIDGSLKRGCCSRANQMGPESYGFRGNAKNLDLNRDFIKADAFNTRSFISIFREWDPEILIDTHVSDGADYQYTMTLISTQHNKLGGPVGTFLKNEMTPALFKMMKAAGHEMSPYVNTAKYDDSPENGIFGFLETPRFASGYAALFQCMSFVLETHMLKPFASRVTETQILIEFIITYTSNNSKQIIDARNKSKQLIKSQKDFVLTWQLDSSQFETINFNGYEATYRESKVTGQQQLYFNRNRPYTRPVKFYDTYKPAVTVTSPEFYILPQAWNEIAELLQLNKVTMTRLVSDTVIETENYYISDFKTAKDPYEGHYLHNSTVVTSQKQKIHYFKGDFIIPVNQDCNRYIVETLEPTAPDSWFNWGFFDAILQQKEWFSAYVFDEMAEKLLNENPSLKTDFEKKKSEDKEFAASSFSQLYYIYRNSSMFEDHKRYPIGRITR